MKKLAGIFFALLLAVSIAALPAAARESTGPVEAAAAFSSGEEITPFADVIELKYRVYNGLLQVRRWNATWGYWVDPEWITVGTEID